MGKSFPQRFCKEIQHYVKYPQGTEWIEKSQVDTQLALNDSLWASLPEEIQRQILARSTTYGEVSCLSLVCKAWFLCIHRGDGITSTTSYSVCDVRSTVEAAAEAQKDSFSRDNESSYVLAWLAYKHGMADEATKLLQKPKTHIRTLIPVRLLWLIVLKMGQSEEPFEKILAELKSLYAIYPSNESHYKDLREYIAVLETMMVEEQQHNERMKGKIFAELSEDEQIEELIYQLRTQNGYQMCQPGACDLLADRRANNPLRQLIQRGYSVIPKLIPHLEDSTLTRSVGYHRNFYFSHHVLRVGDCCLRAVMEITKRSFYKRTTTNSYASSENQLPSIKAQVEQWWSDFGSKGKKQMYIEQILGFDHYEAETTMEEFVKEFPEDVLALFSTVFDGRECPVANQLFAVLARIEPQTSEALSLLTKEFAFRPSVPKALVCLRVKNFDLAPVTAFVLKTYPLCLNSTRRDDFEAIVDYFVQLDIKEGLRLMIETVPSLSDTYTVNNVCSAIIQGSPMCWSSPLRKLNYPKECWEIICLCLRVTSRTRNGELRSCDEIAKILAKNKKYTFSEFTSEENRDRQIAKILFTLRKENSLEGALDEPMDVDQLPNSDAIPLTQVYSLFCKYAESKRTGDEKTLALESDIKGYGFKIIPTIDKFIVQSQSKDEKDALRALARDMAFRVQSVNVIGRTTAALDAILAPLRQMQHFDYHVIARVARSAALAKLGSVYIQYARFKDQLGVNLRVEIGEGNSGGYIDNALVYNGKERKQITFSSSHLLSAQQLKEYTDIIDGFTHRTPFVGYFRSES